MPQILEKALRFFRMAHGSGAGSRRQIDCSTFNQIPHTCSLKKPPAAPAGGFFYLLRGGRCATGVAAPGSLTCPRYFVTVTPGAWPKGENG